MFDQKVCFFVECYSSKFGDPRFTNSSILLIHHSTFPTRKIIVLCSFQDSSSPGRQQTHIHGFVSAPKTGGSLPVHWIAS